MRSLIVEDDFLCRRVLSAILTKHGECDVAVNGREALGACNLAVQDGQPYDLICLDIIMPQMNGQDTLLELRALEEFLGVPPVPILMTTSVHFSEGVVESFLRQCNGYLLKPIKRDQLEQTLLELKLI